MNDDPPVLCVWEGCGGHFDVDSVAVKWILYYINEG